MQRRGVTEAEVTAAIRRPGQVLSAPKGRTIHQSKVAGGRMLLRVVVREVAAAYHVITAYRTSKVAKYWRHP